jgi:hypothetical protein
VVEATPESSVVAEENVSEKVTEVPPERRVVDRTVPQTAAWEDEPWTPEPEATVVRWMVVEARVEEGVPVEMPVESVAVFDWE